MDIDVASKLFPNLTTMIVQLLSTGVMFFCFKRFLWKYVQAYLGKRADFIEGNMQEAKAMNDKAKAMLLESEEKARQSALEYQHILASAKEDAQKQQEAMLAKAREQAALKMAQADQEIEAERAQARQEMREEMVDIALEVASRLMATEMTSEENKKMAEGFIDQVVN